MRAGTADVPHLRDWQANEGEEGEGLIEAGGWVRVATAAAAWYWCSRRWRTRPAGEWFCRSDHWMT